MPKCSLQLHALKFVGAGSISAGGSLPQSVAIGDWVANFISDLSIRKPLAHRYKSHVPFSALSVVQAIIKYFRLPTSNSYVSTGSGHLWESFLFFFFFASSSLKTLTYINTVSNIWIFSRTPLLYLNGYFPEFENILRSMYVRKSGNISVRLLCQQKQFLLCWVFIHTFTWCSVCLFINNTN